MYQDIKDLIDLNLQDASKIPAAKHREVEYALLDYIQLNIAQQGDIKRVKCDIAYLQANFDNSGLGKNLRLGWAICNGNNGTDNLAGRVGIGYGGGVYSLGATGGSPDTVLPEHSHFAISTTQNEEISSGYFFNPTSSIAQFKTNDGDSKYALAVGSSPATVGKTSVTGTSSIDGTNLPPWVANLYIMKL